MSRLTKIIAPILRAHGLDVRPVEGLNGDIRELVVTNPSFPHWGRIIVDCDGLLEWDLWGDLDRDDGAAALARVITGILSSGDQPDPDRYGRRPSQPEVAKSHP
jgi:hypothetical protein